MDKFRTYGHPPYRVALLHGGPGAPGTMGPLAKILAPRVSVLEPLQSAMSIEGLVEELREILEGHAELPAILVGSSWGAMFGFMYTAVHPEHVRKLILVGSGPFEEHYAEAIRPTRVSRLSAAKQEKVRQIFERLEALEPAHQLQDLDELNELFNEADAFDPLAVDRGLVEIKPRQHVAVWEQARDMRSRGELLDLADRVRCRVVAIHGDYDPHPAAGVEEPLGRKLKDFEFFLLKNCGHTPWIERRAKDLFLEILFRELELSRPD